MTAILAAAAVPICTVTPPLASYLTLGPVQKQGLYPMLDSPDVASLTLARHPFKTLYYFSCSVASGTASAAHFVATHPVTLGIALPILLLYASAKGLGLYSDATGLLEVSCMAHG